MNPIGQFYQDNPDIMGHGQDHLADIFRLLVNLFVKGDLADLGDSIDDVGHFLAKKFVQIIQGGISVLHRVVQEAADHGNRVQAHLGQEIGNFQRVGQIRFAAQASLTFMGLG